MIPIHPVLVHFPIAFFLLEAALISWWGVAKNEKCWDSARMLFIPAYLSLCAAMISGYLSTRGFSEMGDLTRRHFYFSTAFFLFTTTRAVVWKWMPRNRALQVTGVVIGAGLLVWAAYLGGRQVYS
jgi:uncharacterized membrane protein